MARCRRHRSSRRSRSRRQDGRPAQRRTRDDKEHGGAVDYRGAPPELVVLHSSFVLVEQRHCPEREGGRKRGGGALPGPPPPGSISLPLRVTLPDCFLPGTAAAVVAAAIAPPRFRICSAPAARRSTNAAPHCGPGAHCWPRLPPKRGMETRHSVGDGLNRRGLASNRTLDLPGGSIHTLLAMFAAPGAVIAGSAAAMYVAIEPPPPPPPPPRLLIAQYGSVAYATSISAVISHRANVRPNCTASVFLATLRSVSMSRRLLMASSTVARQPVWTLKKSKRREALDGKTLDAGR